MGQFAGRLEADWPLLEKALPAIFTTQDYVEALKQSAPATWKAITEKHGPGGRGSGNYYSPANIAFNFLKRLSARGSIFRRQFVPSEPGWGSQVVAQWELSTPISSIPPLDEDLEFVEGSFALRQHLVRERALALRPHILREREKVGLSCDCCGRVESKLDIRLQRSMFEIHHRTPLAEGPRTTKRNEVDLLCATCHRLIHRSILIEGRNVTADELAKTLGLGNQRR